jgi:hypothetical protein
LGTTPVREGAGRNELRGVELQCKCNRGQFYKDIWCWDIIPERNYSKLKQGSHNLCYLQ